MQQGNCWLLIDRNSDVPIAHVTPAELVLLVATHSTRAGKHPVHDLVVDTTEAMSLTDAGGKRDDAEEIDRLRHKYGINDKKQFKVDVLYPGTSPKLPATFTETKLVALSQPPQAKVASK